MSLEEIINQILLSHSDIKRQEIMQIIENKKREAGDFLTDQTAARLAASELGVKIPEKSLRLKIQIKDLLSGYEEMSSGSTSLLWMSLLAPRLQRSPSVLRAVELVRALAANSYH